MIGTLLNQRFSLDQELGRGGMGTVYRATDQVLQRTVAIKVLKDLSGEEVGRKIRLEAQILARLLHENVVRLYDFGVADGTYFLVMEEVNGSSFQKRWRKIALSERLRILAQVADALDYAHHQGIIHRDVKPANILLTASDQAKLSDFGLSMLAEETQESGVTRGTPNYMSPEQAKGKRLDHRSDLYALGIILYECSTGTLPFQGPIISVMSQHVLARPDPPRERNAEVPEPLEALILNLLAKNPDDRPGSGLGVARALREMLDPDRGLMTAVPAAQAGNGGLSAIVPSPLLGPGIPAAPATATATLSATRPSGSARSLARSLIDLVEDEPIVLSADERYLCGHYLAYLLGGSRRRGLFRRRPLDERNADRARLLLAMTSIMIAGPSEESIGRAAELLDERPDVRPALSPIVVVKYLDSRDSVAKRKRFRQARLQLKLSSRYAHAHMVDAGGALNPGLMPQTLDDLRRIAPARTEVDDDLVQRWNRIAEAWRTNFEFRQAVLRYATTNARRDPASVGLWPEVVYPLIERARWQRRGRSRIEALLDAVSDNLHIPDAGVRLDQAIRQAVPRQVAAKLDAAPAEFVEEPLMEEPPAEAKVRDPGLLGLGSGIDSASFEDLDAQATTPSRGLVRLVGPDPIRLTLGDLADLWKEAVAALKTPGTKAVHRSVPIGPYRLAVIPSIRGRSASTLAIQGMPNKQIELLTPSLRAAGGASKPILAAWIYQNQGLVIAYLDFKNIERYILWDAAAGHQANYNDPAALNHNLYQLGMEAPDQLDRALSKHFRPRNPA